MVPKLRHLHIVLEVARIGQIGAVARHVHLTQPAVTQAVANVERYLGGTLFVRSSSGMKLTAAGNACINRIDRAVTQLREGLVDLLRDHERSSQAFESVALQLTSAQLLALSAFTEHGSFSGAARAVGRAEPTVHRAARTLERTVGVVLFEHTSFGLKPTRDAEMFSRCIRRAMNEILQARSDVGALQGNTSGRTVIGAMPLARSFIVPRAIIDFAEEYPAHSVSIVEGTYEHLLAGLQSGTVDLLIGALREGRMAGDVRQEPLFDDRLSIVARAGHPLHGRRRLRPTDLARYPWIVPRPSSPLHGHFENLFAGQASKPVAQVQCNSLIAARAFLLEGDYLMLSSSHQIHYELRAGLLTTLPHPHGEVVRTIGLTRRRDWHPTRAQVRLLDLLGRRARETALADR